MHEARRAIPRAWHPSPPSAITTSTTIITASWTLYVRLCQAMGKRLSMHCLYPLPAQPHDVQTMLILTLRGRRLGPGEVQQCPKSPSW